MTTGGSGPSAHPPNNAMARLLLGKEVKALELAATGQDEVLLTEMWESFMNFLRSVGNFEPLEPLSNYLNADLLGPEFDRELLEVPVLYIYLKAQLRLFISRDGRLILFRERTYLHARTPPELRMLVVSTNPVEVARTLASLVTEEWLNLNTVGSTALWLASELHTVWDDECRERIGWMRRQRDAANQFRAVLRRIH